jgi:hypothetical protein
MAALQPGQCPPKRGLRFAANAAMPSRASSVPYSTAPTAGSLLGGVGLIELFGDHARWMSEPGPFLDDLDTIYRRR